MIIDVGMRHDPIASLAKDHLLHEHIVDDTDIGVGQFAHDLTRTGARLVFVERKNFMTPFLV
jgi:hypothetical protein